MTGPEFVRRLRRGPQLASNPSYSSRFLVRFDALAAYNADPSEVNRLAFLASLEV